MQYDLNILFEKLILVFPFVIHALPMQHVNWSSSHWSIIPQAIGCLLTRVRVVVFQLQYRQLDQAKEVGCWKGQPLRKLLLVGNLSLIWGTWPAQINQLVCFLQILEILFDQSKIVNHYLKILIDSFICTIRIFWGINAVISPSRIKYW